MNERTKHEINEWIDEGINERSNWWRTKKRKGESIIQRRQVSESMNERPEKWMNKRANGYIYIYLWISEWKNEQTGERINSRTTK